MTDIELIQQQMKEMSDYVLPDDEKDEDEYDWYSVCYAGLGVGGEWMATLEFWRTDSDMPEDEMTATGENLQSAVNNLYTKFLKEKE